MRTRLALAALSLTLSLPLLAPARPAAAAQLTVVAQATGDKDPFVLCFADDPKGQTGLDKTMGQKLHDSFASVQYLFTDQGQLLIGRLNGQDLQLVAPPALAAGFNKNTYFVVHARSADSKTFVDGVVFQFSDDPTQGLANLTVTLQDGKGNSRSAHIEQSLAWAGANNGGGGGQGDGGNDGGFGSF
jgi:hypothetical protein